MKYPKFALIIVLLISTGSTILKAQDKITDFDGNVYNTVTIGTQVWMVENLKTTHYNDGTPIPLVTDEKEWKKLSTPGYCWYNNDSVANKATYGALYNWYAVGTGKLCPIGWHVPSDDEWRTLFDYLINNGYGYKGDAEAIAKSMAATSGWVSTKDEGSVGNDQGSNNSSGFTATPGGYRSYVGPFFFLGSQANWWSSDECSKGIANFWGTASKCNKRPTKAPFDKPFGFSVRCIKD
jgi:uncharacterized protein (TIGR02145 family)